MKRLRIVLGSTLALGAAACGLETPSTRAGEVPCKVTSTPDGGATVTCGDTHASVGGMNALPAIKTRHEEEPRGAHCPEGGVRILFGYDRDGDGVLGDDEITDTHYACGKTLDTYTLRYAGNLHIDSPQALAAATPYTHVTGDVVYTCDIPVDTLGLPQLREVGGSVVLHAHPQVANFRGMPNMARIGGTLQITDNPALVSLEGLEGLTEVGGLVISGNGGLEEFTGLPALVQVHGGVTIANNGQLHTLQAMDAAAPQTRGAIGGPVTITGNPNLKTVAGFGNFVHLMGDTTLEDNPVLERVSGFASVTQLDGHFKAVHLTRLVALDGFEALHTAGGVLITRNERLTALSAFPALQYVARDVGIVANPALGTVTALQALQRVDGTVRVVGNPLLRALDGMGALRVAGAVDISANRALMDVQGLAALTHVEKTLVLKENPALGSVMPLRALSVVNGDMTIADNGALHTLDGLIGLQHVGGALHIARNAALAQVDGLHGLEEIAGDLVVEENTALLTLEGLGRIVRVRGDVRIIGNSALRSLTALAALHTIDGGLIVTHNAALEDVDLPALRLVGRAPHLENNPKVAPDAMRKISRAIAYLAGDDAT